MNTAYKPTTDEIKRLREETGAGMADVRNALIWAEGDHERAKARLAETGQAKATEIAAEPTGQRTHLAGGQALRVRGRVPDRRQHGSGSGTSSRELAGRKSADSICVPTGSTSPAAGE